jgi:hypothetical protein
MAECAAGFNCGRFSAKTTKTLFDNYMKDRKKEIGILNVGSTK